MLARALCSRLAVVLVGGVVLLAGWSSCWADDDAKAAVGDWQGKLKVGLIELRLVFKLKQTDAGGLAGTLESVDQGSKDIPLDDVTLKDGTLRAESKAIGGVFEGKLDPATSTIEGKFTQGGQALPLTLKRGDAPFKLARPQEPKPPFPYREEEVRVENRQANLTLAGTLTLPDSQSPVAAVVLISGSGSQDRDEAIMGHRPFFVLADHLTRKGIAVLRVDDRGFGKSTGDATSATTVDFKNDALACVEYLKGRKEIDPKKIGLCGHSEGGLIAPLAAVESADVAFIVLMAGPGVTGEEILYVQGGLILKAEGASPVELARQKASQQMLFKIIKEESDPAALKAKLKAAIEGTLTAEEKKELEDNAAAAAVQEAMMLTPWFRYFLTYDPAPTLGKVKCPVLAINGEKDAQVSPSQNLPVIEKALRDGGNQDVTTGELPGLNHLFQTCKTGGVSEYSQIEETISPLALAAISDWIVAHSK